MPMSGKVLAVLLLVPWPSMVLAGGVKKKHTKALAEEEITRNVLTVLWREPTDLASRDLYFGPGGSRHQPRGPFTFIKEDLDGSNPKFSVRDRNGVKWKVKLSEEAKPEVVATRLVWPPATSRMKTIFCQLSK